MTWWIKSDPLSAKNLVTIGIQIGSSNPDGASRLQNAACFVQTSEWIMQVLNRMAHGYRGKAAIGVAELRQTSDGNRQARRPNNRRRIGIRL